ncbi:hypothetical protein [Nocardia jinanensis]|uniref:Uncharacterized protein n=1 Tax=Nocardia jinanensis TaxID=382504 RepID=A0A917RQV1_9NOCA|nr:hypothetical protein [Nocardia jinanensis]GGL19697.1 hypothetical protein GCM10011588_37960 [Nocardia jinanensis]
MIDSKGCGRRLRRAPMRYGTTDVLHKVSFRAYRIDTTYNDEDNDIAEVQWGSYAGTTQHT